MDFIVNFLLFPVVKKVWKSVEIWRSYRHGFGGTLFGTRINCYLSNVLPLQCVLYPLNVFLAHFLWFAHWRRSACKHEGLGVPSLLPLCPPSLSFSPPFPLLGLGSISKTSYVSGSAKTWLNMSFVSTIDHLFVLGLQLGFWIMTMYTNKQNSIYGNTDLG